MKYVDNPCEQHLEVETGPFCPICLMNESDGYRKALELIAGEFPTGYLSDGAMGRVLRITRAALDNSVEHDG